MGVRTLSSISYDTAALNGVASVPLAVNTPFIILLYTYFKRGIWLSKFGSESSSPSDITSSSTPVSSIFNTGLT